MPMIEYLATTSNTKGKEKADKKPTQVEEATLNYNSKNIGRLREKHKYHIAFRR